MTPERWREVKQAFQEVLELDPVARAARLAGLDDDTRREVEALIAAAPTEGDGFLETPPVPAGRDAERDDRIGRRVGPWRIVEELGRGGMGAVYLATRADDELRTQVALKVVKRGMDTDVVLRRFRAERQILAGLSHPNIARLLDAGSTDDGTPWFAMELIRGAPIDRYCDDHRLGVRDRLALFTQVCAAVQHAHQNLVVHRDLKPSNILVTDDGRPVLLDFGIAKLLDPEALATVTEHAIMTPAYASPEQLTGSPITTASDVYSLGVLLYELLAGRRPYEATTPQAIERALARGEVPPPSAAVARAGDDARRARQLRGDLDAIVAMAMRAEPDRRYASPRELARDVEAHLAGLPTIARREGVAGRAWKLVRRHRVAATATAAVVLSLVGGVVATARQAQIARAERARAERRFDEVRRLASRLLFDLHDAIADLPGATSARAQLVEESRTYLEGLAREATGRADLLLEVSGAWLRLGDVQGNSGNANLGDVDGARTSYARGLAAAEQALALAPADPAAKVAIAAAVNRSGDLAWEDSDLAAAAAAYERAIAIAREVVAAHPDRLDARHELALSLVDLGDTVQPSAPERTPALYREALALEESLVDRFGGERPRRTVAVLHNKLARLALAAGDRRAALDGYRRSLAIREELLARAPTSAAARRDLSASLTLVAGVLAAEGDLAGARAGFERALEIDQALASADPHDVRALRDVAVSSIKLAELDYEAAGRATGVDRIAHLRAARSGFRRALEAWSELETRGGFTAGDEQLPAALRGAVAEADAALAAEGYTGE